MEGIVTKLNKYLHLFQAMSTHWFWKDCFVWNGSN